MSRSSVRSLDATRFLGLRRVLCAIGRSGDMQMGRGTRLVDKPVGEVMLPGSGTVVGPRAIRGEPPAESDTGAPRAVGHLDGVARQSVRRAAAVGTEPGPTCSAAAWSSRSMTSARQSAQPSRGFPRAVNVLHRDRLRPAELAACAGPHAGLSGGLRHGRGGSTAGCFRPHAGQNADARAILRFADSRLTCRQERGKRNHATRIGQLRHGPAGICRQDAIAGHVATGIQRQRRAGLDVAQRAGNRRGHHQPDKWSAGGIDVPVLSDAERVEILFLATLSRLPDEREMTQSLARLSRAASAGVERGARRCAVGVLNSAEFSVNH